MPLRDLFRLPRFKKTKEAQAEAYGSGATDRSRDELARLLGSSTNEDGLTELYPVPAREILAKLYEYNPYISGLVDFKADTLAALPLRFLDENEDDIAESKVKILHKFLKVSPNSYTTPSQLIKDMSVCLDLFGCFALTIEGKTANNSELACLNPAYITIIPDMDGGKIGMVCYSPPGGAKAEYKPEQVIFASNKSYIGFYQGKSNINPTIISAKGHMHSMNTEAFRFRRGDQIPLVFRESTDVGSGSLQLLKTQLRNRISSDPQGFVVPRELEIISSANYGLSRITVSEYDSKVKEQIATSLGIPMQLITPNSSVEVEDWETLWWETNMLARKKFIEEVLSYAFGTDKNNLSIGINIYLEYRHLRWYSKIMLDRTRTSLANTQGGLWTPNQGLKYNHTGITPHKEITGHDGYGDMPVPVRMQKYAEESARSANSANNGNSASPSASMNGSMGGRDQGKGSEPELIDSTGAK